MVAPRVMASFSNVPVLCMFVTSCVLCCASADPHSNQPLGLNQLYPNLLVRDMVERWLQTGSVVDGAANPAERSCSLHLQQQLRVPSDDPLSSFGASSSSSSSGSDSEPWS
jgi:hypothetical protein